MSTEAAPSDSKIWYWCQVVLLGFAALLFADAGVNKLLDSHTMPRAFAVAGLSNETYAGATFRATGDCGESPVAAAGWAGCVLAEEDLARRLDACSDGAAGAD